MKAIPIWGVTSPTNSRCRISQTKLVEFLNDLGFGKFNNETIQRKIDDKVLSISNYSDITKFVYDFFMVLDEDDFLDTEKYGVVKSIETIEDENDEGEPTSHNVKKFFTKNEVKSALIEYGKINPNISHFLNYYSEERGVLNTDDKHLFTPIFTDTKDEVYSFFQSGAVKITSKGYHNKPYKTIKSEGFIWDTEKEKSIDNIQKISKTEKGIFEKFVEYSMMVQSKSGKWSIDKDEYESLRTVYGYLISTFTNNGETPVPYFVDKMSDGVLANGGNGKSLVMNSIKYWKKLSPINGKNVQKDNRFVFSSVDIDTKFVHIDDVKKDFPFDIIYNYSTGDMEIEKKGKDRFVIPMDKKPKIGVCTNFISTDTSDSTRRRQIIVEFGNFWNHKVLKEGVSVEKMLGKRLFTEFDENDWIQFYNFGFRCVEEFLKKGIVQTDKSNYFKKQLKIQKIGTDDEGVISWMEEFIKKNKKTFADKYEFDVIYRKFMMSFDEYVVRNWEKTRFKKSIYDLCSINGWGYNPHKNGSNVSQKRWKVGPAGNQKEYLRINI